MQRRRQKIKRRRRDRKPIEKKEQHREAINAPKGVISPESPDSVSTDGSSSTEGGAEDAGDERPSKPPLTTVMSGIL
jgi:hypothetical protein